MTWWESRRSSTPPASSISPRARSNPKSLGGKPCWMTTSSSSCGRRRSSPENTPRSSPGVIALLPARALLRQALSDRCWRVWRRSGSVEYRAVRPSGDQWADCRAKETEANDVPFELTELVDAGALPAGDDRPWSPSDVRANLEERIPEKGLRSQTGRGSGEVVLVIHTDEPYIDVALAARAIGDRPFSLRHGDVARAFLRFSHDPQRQGYPFLELKLVAQQGLPAAGRSRRTAK